MKKLSIITCTYNSERYIQECIDSVIAQNLNIENYEHIFVDAYSTDSTKDIIKEYMKKYSNVRLIERKPKGVYNAMNEGIKEAKGEYILCLNSDDWLEDCILNKYLNYIEKTGYVDVYYGKVSYTKDKKKYYTNLDSFIRLRKFLYTNFGCNVLVNQPGVLIKRDLFFGDVGLFDESKKIASDYGLFLKCLSHNKFFCFYPHKVTNFRIHEESLTTNGKNCVITRKECKFFKKKYLPPCKAYLSIVLDYFGEIYGKLFSKITLFFGK